MINPFKKTYNIKELNLFRSLSRIKPFEKLNYEEMALFLPHLYLREYKLDEVVFFRNDPSNAFYMVKSGKVSLNIDINDNFEVLQVLKAGGYFGHNAFLEQGKRMYSSIIVSEISEIYVMPRVNILEIFDRRSKIKSKVMTSVAELYNEFNQNIFNTYRDSLGFLNLSNAFKN